MMSKNSEYSELIYDDYSLKYRSSTFKPNQKLFSLNNLVILLLFTFIGIISLFFILSFNRFYYYYNKFDSFIPLDPSKANSSAINLEPYFDSRSQIYHLAQDPATTAIDFKYQKLNNTSLYCFKEGTNWNQSLTENKCICHPNYSLPDCGLSALLKNKLLKKQTSCHFKQDIVNIERQTRPSKIIFAMPLYNCEKKNCAKFIDDLVNDYEGIVDLFVFIEIRSESTESTATTNQLNDTSSSNLNVVDERVHLFSLNLNKSNQDKQQDNLTSTSSANQMKTNQNMKQFKNVIYQIKTVDLEGKQESIDVNKKIYNMLWNLVFNNVANYRSQDKIIFLPPFNQVEKPILNFFKYYSGYGEPIVLVDKFHLGYINRRIPKDIEEDLNSISSSIMMTFQYTMNVCKFKFENFQVDYCLRNLNLVQNFEKKFWKVCKRTAVSLDSNPAYY